MKIGETTTRLVMSSKDLADFRVAMAVALEKAKKFLFTDISRDNLTALVADTSKAFRASIGEREFMCMETHQIFRFKYMSVHVNNDQQTVEIKPVFVKVGDLIAYTGK